jgi:hypothetical protein
MQIRRSLGSLCLVVSLAACASVPARAPQPAPAITFDLAASPARAREQLLGAFAANGLPVAASQPGVVEFHGARERGILGYDEVFARAVITPLDCGTRVTMFGEETHYANATTTEGTAKRIGPASTGRAHEVWQKLASIASTLRGDSTAVSRART